MNKCNVNKIYLNLPPPDRSIFLQSPPPSCEAFEEIVEDPPYKPHQSELDVDKVKKNTPSGVPQIIIEHIEE